MTQQPKAKIEKLMKQYPGIRKLVDGEFPPPRLEDPAIRVTVEVADATLLYTFGDTLTGSYMFSDDLPGLRGQRTESVSAFGKNDVYLGGILWETSYDRRRTGDLFTEIAREKRWDLGRVLEEVEYLVWATVVDWHKEASGDEVFAGRIVKTEADYTVRIPPRDGLLRLYTHANPFTDVVLTSDMVTNACILEDDDFLRILQDLGKLAKDFESGVWGNGFEPVFRASHGLGRTSVFHGVTLVTGELCGTVGFTLLHGDSMLELRGNDTGDLRLRFHSIQMATLPQAKAMVRAVIDGWTALSPEQRSVAHQEVPRLRFVSA